MHSYTVAPSTQGNRSVRVHLCGHCCSLNAQSYDSDPTSNTLWYYLDCYSSTCLVFSSGWRLFLIFIHLSSCAEESSFVCFCLTRMESQYITNDLQTIIAIAEFWLTWFHNIPKLIVFICLKSGIGHSCVVRTLLCCLDDTDIIVIVITTISNTAL